jgi:nicotinamide-nucleotide amidase
MMVALSELMLREPHLTLAVAESATCGRVQSRIGEMSGVSKFFFGGITAYTLDQKVRHLRVDRATAEPVNCVSAEVAEQMARGVCELFGSDLGLATTGYAEPLAEWDIEHPFAWWAVAQRKPAAGFVRLSGRIECPHAERLQAQQLFADAALGGLIEYLRRTR